MALVAPSTRAIDEAAKYNPEPFRKQIVDGGAEAFSKGLIEALQPSATCYACKRPRYQTWAYRTFARVARLTETEPQVLIALFQAIGVKDERELAEVVSEGRRFRELGEGVSHEQMRLEVRDLMRSLHQAHPEWRAEDLAFLGSHAEAVEQNGTG